MEDEKDVLVCRKVSEGPPSSPSLTMKCHKCGEDLYVGADLYETSYKPRGVLLACMDCTVAEVAVSLAKGEKLRLGATPEQLSHYEMQLEVAKMRGDRQGIAHWALMVDFAKKGVKVMEEDEQKKA